MDIEPEIKSFARMFNSTAMLTMANCLIDRDINAGTYINKLHTIISKAIENAKIRDVCSQSKIRTGLNNLLFMGRLYRNLHTNTSFDVDSLTNYVTQHSVHPTPQSRASSRKFLNEMEALSKATIAVTTLENQENGISPLLLHFVLFKAIPIAMAESRRFVNQSPNVRDSLLRHTRHPQHENHESGPSHQSSKSSECSRS